MQPQIYHGMISELACCNQRSKWSALWEETYNEDAPSNKLEQVYEEASLKGGGKAC